MSATKRLDVDHEISKAEKEAMEAKEKLAKLRRRLPGLEVEDYTLLDAAGEKVALSSLFGEKDELILIHNMGKSCPYCTMWADGFNGVVKHLEDRAAFVVVSPDPPEEQTKFAASRGWTFGMLSAHDTSFAKDLGFQAKGGGYKPGVSVFRKGHALRVQAPLRQPLGGKDRLQPPASAPRTRCSRHPRVG